MSLRIGPTPPVQLEIEFDTPPRYTGQPVTSRQVTGKANKAFDAGALDYALGLGMQRCDPHYSDGRATMMAHACFPQLDGRPVHYLYNEAFSAHRLRTNWGRA